MSNRIAILNSVIIVTGIPFLIALWLAPFNFFVDIEYVDHQDVCEGETVQTVVSMRQVKWKGGYEGHIFSELYRFEDGLKYETVIKRDTDFLYQPSDEPVRYQIEWSEPLPVGDYGVSSLVKINPVFEKTDYRNEETQRFSVVKCDEYAI